MYFERIKYLEWARENLGRVPYDLANSQIRRLRPDEFGLTLKQIPLHGSQEWGDPELLQTVAAMHKARPSQVAVSVGASTGLFLVLSAVLSSGDEVLLEAPNYEPLYRIIRHIGADVKTMDRLFEKGFQLDLEALERRISRHTRAVILTNLHNPTGVATHPEKLQTVGQIAREFGAYVICSEVYRDGAFDLPPVHAVNLGENMISLGSVSKIFGLGGVRLGWIVADEKIIELVHRLEHYLYGETPFPSQRIALQALKRRDDLRQRALDILRPNFKILQEWVSAQDDVRWVPPDGGTVAFLQLLHGLDSWDLHRLAKERHQTLVVPGDFFWAKGFIRVAFGGEEEILRRGLENLGNAIRDAMREKRS